MRTLVPTDPDILLVSHYEETTGKLGVLVIKNEEVIACHGWQGNPGPAPKEDIEETVNTWGIEKGFLTSKHRMLGTK
jgi:hypothetical protein